MEILFLGVALLLLTALIVGFLLLSQKLKNLSEQKSLSLLKQDLLDVSQNVRALSERVSDQLAQNHLSVQDSLTKQLSQSSRLVADVATRLAKLDETNQRVISVADELKTLQNVLQNPKQRGVFGEFYLESILTNVLPVGQFQMQYKFPDGQIVDAVIFLDQNKILPLDSKFSLENYNRFIQTNQPSARTQLLQKIKTDLKNRIDETSKYVRPHENTMDFAFMFIPSEALYYDLLIGSVGTGATSRDLIEYAFRDRQVIIVSPTNLMAYLQTVLQGLKSLQIENQAREIQKRLTKLQQHLGKFDQYLDKLGHSLTLSLSHYNTAHQEFAKLSTDVSRITGVDSPTSKITSPTLNSEK